jgi:hypothetical protein
MFGAPNSGPSVWWYEDEVAAFGNAFSKMAPGIEISWSPGGTTGCLSLLYW